MVEIKDKKKWMKFGAFALIVLSWGLLIGFKSAKENYDGGILTIISIIVTIAGLFFVYGEKIWKNMNVKKEEVPEAIDKEKINKIILEEVEKRWNNLRIGKPIEWTKTKTIDKNIIYAFRINLDIDDETFIIVINANYPSKIPTILEPFDRNGEEISQNKINDAMNSMASNPLDEPDLKERDQLDQYGNVVARVREKIFNKDKKEEKKEEII